MNNRNSKQTVRIGNLTKKKKNGRQCLLFSDWQRFSILVHNWKPRNNRILSNLSKVRYGTILAAQDCDLAELLCIREVT